MQARILVAVYGAHRQGVVSALPDYEVRVPGGQVDALDAIAAAEQRGRRFDLLVLDAGMPECLEAAEYAKDLGWRAPVIFVSTTDDLELRLKASAIRCDAFLVLPDELEQLQPLVAVLMEEQ
ncbi:MAG: response regulator [Acidobacteria bacterium]|nr:response regulator [Acidobacteriota bacterium]